MEDNDRNEIIKAGNADDRNLPAKTKNKIVKGLSNINNAKISNVLTNIFGKAEISADFVKYLQRGKVYLAEIPKKLQPDFESGDLKFMTVKETGDQVGEIVGKNNFGTHGHVIIKEGNIIHSDIPHDITTIVMQQQLAKIAAAVDEVRCRVIALQNTYDESLLGRLRGMRDQLTQVQSINDVEIKRNLILNAISILNDTRGIITQRLIGELRHMPDVPHNTFIRIGKTFLTAGFYDKVVSGYEKIQELFGYYLVGTQLLAYAYAFLGVQEAFMDIFSPDKELMQKPLLENLKFCEDIVKVQGEHWYNCPQKYLGYLESEVDKVFLEDSELTTFEVTGDQLLEAIEGVGE